MKRTGSVETEGGQDSPRGRTPGASGKHSSSSRFKKSVSIDNTIAESDQLWKSTDSRGSNESLASNASIPLPIPVRTRSARGGSESGYSSDTYNAMTIKRLERDTSVDRLSTGSRESMQSTQSELLPGEKKKSKGLLGKLKSITKKADRSISEEREFGSGSDISSVSVASKTSKTSTSSKMSTATKLIQRARSASKDRLTKTEKGPFGPPGNANAAFDKYFDKAEAGNTGAAGDKKETPTSSSSTTAASSSSTSAARSSSSATSSSSSLPRTYRRF